MLGSPYYFTFCYSLCVVKERVMRFYKPHETELELKFFAILLDAVAKLVEMVGIEPATSCLQSTRSPN